MQNALVFLVEAYFKLVLNNSSEIGHCKINFYNICVKLYRIRTEVKIILKQEIIELVRLSVAEIVENMGFSSP